VMRMGLGVDGARLDLFHDYMIDNVDGFTTELFEFHCTEGKTWVSDADGKTYQIPDEINAVVPLPAGEAITGTGEMYNTNDVKKVKSHEVGVDILGGMFTASASYKKDQDRLMNATKFLSQSKAIISLYEILYIPSDFLGKSLNKYARNSIDTKLPAKFEMNPAAYVEFFQTYGTHYFERTNQGGVLTMNFENDDILKTSMTDKDRKMSADATFFSKLKLHGAYGGNVNKSAQQFSQHSQQRDLYFGGVANLFEKEGYKAWWPTVPQKPWIYSGILKPITDLIAGPKKTEMMRASTVYFDKFFLNEMQRNLFSYLSRHPMNPTVQQMVNQVNHELAMVIPDHNSLQPLYDSINNYVLSHK